jgi:hypothetical protein
MPTPDPPRNRLLWNVVVDAIPHRLTLVPPSIGSWVAVELDGRRVARLRTPNRKDPWREATVEIGRSAVTIALIHHWLGMRTDVFVDGRSLIDGRTPGAVREFGPAPLRGYERWFGSAAAERRRPTAFEVAYLVGVFSLFVGLPVTVLGISRGRALPFAVAVAASAVTLFVAFYLLLLIWSAMLSRLNSWLLARPMLGDGRRAAIFLAASFGPPLVPVVVALIVIWLG